MIGRCSKTQTVSWDQETKLWDGISYDINFFQDFSELFLEGRAIADISVSEIIQAIPFPPDEVSEYPAASYPSAEDYRKSQELWESVKKYEEEERKREKKWRREHPRPKSQKEIERNLDRIIKDLMRE